LIGLVVASSASAAAAAPGRERLAMDAGWRFAFGHPSEPARDFDHATRYFSYLAKAGFGDGPAAPEFDDRAWRTLDLPHDWAVEAPFSPKGSYSHGFKAIGRNFPDRTIGWYRKHFPIPASDLGRRVSVEFDGVFRDSVVWVNGFYLGRQSSGYSGFRYDLTDYLNYGGENVVVVRVDAALEEGWFYEGAGIYRHVWLNKTAPLHVAPWGTAVSTEIVGGSARLDVRTEVSNAAQAEARFDIQHTVVGAEGRAVVTKTLPDFRLGPGATGEFAATLTVSQPKLWTLESPVLHRLVTVIRADGVELDRYETTFGIRTIRFDPNEGFFLNDRHVTLKGTNMHQDHAGVGVALPDALQEFRLKRLKEIGSNAYRASHHPPTTELLDACDRLGILVVDEHRLMGTTPEHLGLLETLIRRDRNHPSVILWSLGNEEWAIEGNVKGARIASTMQAHARRLDPGRLTAVAISGGWGGISTVVDVMGVNYIKHGDTDKQHAEFPRQIIVGTEETTMQETRGVVFDDRARAHQGPQLQGTSGNNLYAGWQHYAARPYSAGVFFWTGFDYRGEPIPFDWPAISSQFGILDTCGFPKDSANYLRSWWTDEPVLAITPHWNWSGREGQEIPVVCYSNHEEVELFLNGRSLGRKAVPRNAFAEWKVPYAPGILEARGWRAGSVVATVRTETTGAPARLALTADRSTISADGTDVVVFTVSAHDAQGRAVPTANFLAHFEIQGGQIIGVGNGDPSCHEADRFVETVDLKAVGDWHGRIVSGTTAKPGELHLLSPLPEVSNWLAPLPGPTEGYELSGTFTSDSVPSTAALELFLPALGAKMSVWLNERELVRDLDTSVTGPAVRLESAQLVSGVNRVQVLVEPFRDQRARLPELTRFGSLRVASPAPPVQRSLFNGLAQVIVQATEQAGPIRLVAKAAGLEPAESTVTSRAVEKPVSVP
jgi:beta-galactosidase